MGNKSSKSKRNKGKKVIVKIERSHLTVSALGELPQDTWFHIVQCLDFKTWKRLRLLNGHFFYLFHPLRPEVQHLWKDKVHCDFPLTPTKLKCRRWDLFYNYKMLKIDTVDFQDTKDVFEIKERFEDNHNEFMVIEGCDFDINRINKTTQYNADDLWQGAMNKTKHIPEGMETFKLYCPVIAYENFKYLDYVNSKTYKCIVCKNTVHSVTSLKEA
eukprot:714705_1